MTRTGYSCAHMRRKNKPGCSADTVHWCSEKCKLIDPMTCHKSCDSFATIISGGGRCCGKSQRLKDELL